MISIRAFIINLLSILVIIISHEVSHGIVAYWNGDDTAKKYGRLTLNPFKHLDIIGTICLVMFKFGWAKPVPVNPNNYKHTRLGMFSVAIAGILTNFITAYIFSFLLIYVYKYKFVFDLFNSIVIYGIMLAIFNFLPIPPLDGSKILASILPYSFSNFMDKYDKYSFILLIGVVYSGLVSKYMIPIVQAIYKYFIETNFIGRFT